MSDARAFLTWPQVLRLALVQTAIGTIVVLATSTLNRIMIVELALPALVPALLVAAHYLAQLLRPHHGYRVDQAGRASGRILGGMAMLALGAISAACAAAWMRTQHLPGIVLAAVSYLVIGFGVGAAGTANLSLLSKSVAPERRALVAALVWIMMILGFSLSAGLAGHFLQPFSTQRLVEVFVVTCLAAFALAALAVNGIEAPRFGARGQPAPAAAYGRQGGGFAQALARVFVDPAARCFTAFLFVAMLAFSAQELLLEPFGGLVFGLPPAATARLAGLQNGGVVAGMLALVAAALWRRPRTVQFNLAWMTAGTLGSALGVAGLALVAARGQVAWLAPTAFLLGLANGAFAVSALGVMMELSTAGVTGSEGLRMGVWGAAQALAFAAGGRVAGGSGDLMRAWTGSPAAAYVTVFALDALLFVAAANWAWRLGGVRRAQVRTTRAQRMGSHA